MSQMYPNVEKMAPVPDAPPMLQHEHLQQGSGSYDPPPPYMQAPGQQAPVVGPQTVTVVVDTGKFGPYPKAMQCYHCGQQVMTTVTKKAGTITWALCSLLCIVGCFCGCCLIPFCASPTQDMMHRCPNCQKFLGAYERIKFRR
ncbi:LITAF domain-containing protein-like [Oppia nitens]|uniref:LITAF domain-containing protein-like n=1 Tax=Oppia nitens TaxID=1686743 RepID=UPI0023D997BE|nr:LITAF domain-containing protein-like [Oppia nitens]